METRKVDIIIPTYRPGQDFPELLRRLSEQTVQPDRIRIVNTEESFWDHGWDGLVPRLEVRHIKREEFDHGGTRRQEAERSDADILVFMTQDALPADRLLLQNLLSGFSEEEIGAVYARQLPGKNAGEIEKITRGFNYPPFSCVKGEEDVLTYGIKTYFCSNVCAAYRADIYRQTGGFEKKAIFNEDMIYVGHMLQQGWKVAYTADAKVIHSHNYTAVQQFHRNFDLGVSQAEHPEVFAAVPSEGEGMRLVKETAMRLVRKGRPLSVITLAWQSAAKYLGYSLGKHYRSLPGFLVKRCTTDPGYFGYR
ncbi:MAG: glycosyltransferase family 2 protein [Blautia sp.]|nr:glycosyltransferase family 2 protein [Blautia sp.]